jgi:peptidoglycan-associated lipoprotein
MLKAEDLQPVFFEFDSAVLTGQAHGTLDHDAQTLRDHPGTKVVIEGHCDERGTVEYNQALGERRAQAVRDYLVAAGIEAGRLEVISYGKERPFDQGHDEAAWAKNRRAHFTVGS